MTSQEYQAQHGQGPPRGPAASVRAAPAARPRAKKPSVAAALTRALLELLHLHGFAAWRQNNAGVYDASFGGYRAGSAVPGIADILGYCRRTGRFCAVEVKAGRDRLRPEQTAFLASVREAGGFACEGRDVAQVEAELRRYLASPHP